jgi:hypothetical protein
MMLATSTEPQTVSTANTTRRPGGAPQPALPAVSTALGWIPLNNRFVPKSSSEGLLVNLESDGSWEKDGPGRRMWKAELTEDNDIKISWQEWQRRVTDTIRDALAVYPYRTYRLAFRMQIDRNGDVFKITPDNLSTDPSDNTVMFINHLKPYLSVKPFPAIPASSGAHLVYVHAQVKETTTDPKRPWHLWWQDD